MRGSGVVVWPEEAGEGERPPMSSPACRGRHGHPPCPRRPAKAIPLPTRSMAVRHGVARPPNANTCFLDRTPAMAKRVESSGEEERDQGDGCGAPWRSPHDAESETAFAATDDVRCSKGALTTLPAQMSLSMSDSIVPTRVVDDSTAPPCPPAVVAAAL
jgi:hypothetical protein